MSATALQVKQLAIRLDNATSVERIDTLQELQNIAKQTPEVVGEFAMKKVLDLLKEQGSAEEYQEALDLIYRLIKCRDKEAAKKNTSIILEEQGHVELLLDLLEHEDAIIGVTASQLLTEIHAVDGATLEAMIQLCPDGDCLRTALRCIFCHNNHVLRRHEQAAAAPAGQLPRGGARPGDRADRAADGGQRGDEEDRRLQRGTRAGVLCLSSCVLFFYVAVRRLTCVCLCRASRSCLRS